jgi:hypothetical protein
MRRPVWVYILGVCWAGCGGASWHNEGDCTAPPDPNVVTILKMDQFSGEISASTGPFLVQSQQEFDTFVARNMFSIGSLAADLGPIDFQVTQIIIVPTNNGGGLTEIRFLTASADRLDLGLLERPAGILGPNLALVTARTAQNLVVHVCRSVCSGACQPIP